MDIDNILKIDDLKLIKYLQEADSEFLPDITKVFKKVKIELENRIPVIFPNYTLHNIDHSIRIIKYMGEIVSDISKLDELEVAILIHSALLHDIGMAVSDDDIKQIKADNFPEFEIKYSNVLNYFENEDLALQEYVRMYHSSLSARYIRNELGDLFKISGLALDFSEELALICESHTQNFDWLINYLTVNEPKGNYRINPQYISCVLRLADILDVDSNRTPYNLYKLINPKGVSKDEWEQHFVVSNSDKIKKSDKTNLKTIYLHGKCHSPNVHRKLLNYIDWIKQELLQSTEIVNTMSQQYNLLYETEIEVQIQPVGYTFSDYKMTLDYKAISALLMGEKIYGNKTLGLRELIQNSLDSCRLRLELENLSTEIGREEYTPKVKVILNCEKQEVTIKDNGMGMSLEVIKNHFLNIGVSYYNSRDFKFRNFNYKPIGNFGIGFLSCFMLSDNVKVITRNYKSKDKYLINLQKNEEYTSLTKSEDLTFHGTEIILEYSSFLNAFQNNTESISSFLKHFFLTDTVILEFYEDRNVPLTISNNLNDKIELKQGHYKIDINRYLPAYQGYVVIRNKEEFISNISQLDTQGTLYAYEFPQGLIEIEDSNDISIGDYVNNYSIKYASIPLIEEHMEKAYENGMNFTDDYLPEVIDKLEKDLNWISVLIPKTIQDDIFDKELSDYDNNIFEEFSFDNLLELGHSEKCKTQMTVKEITVFEGKLDELYLPFVNKSTRPYYFGRDKKRKELFVRNVLIRDFEFDVLVQASIFDIETIVLNIDSRKYIPEISRNNFDEESQKLINFEVSKAIHLGALEVLSLSADKNNTLRRFIEEFYSE